MIVFWDTNAMRERMSQTELEAAYRDILGTDPPGPPHLPRFKLGITRAF